MVAVRIRFAGAVFAWRGRCDWNDPGSAAVRDPRVCRKGLAAQLEADFAAVGLPTVCPVPVSAMREAISKDKKADGGSVHFVLIKDIGRVEVRLLPVDTIIQLLETANI